MDSGNHLRPRWMLLASIWFLLTVVFHHPETKAYPPETEVPTRSNSVSIVTTPTNTPALKRWIWTSLLIAPQETMGNHGNVSWRLGLREIKRNGSATTPCICAKSILWICWKQCATPLFSTCWGTWSNILFGWVQHGLPVLYFPSHLEWWDHLTFRYFSGLNPPKTSVDTQLSHWTEYCNFA